MILPRAQVQEHRHQSSIRSLTLVVRLRKTKDKQAVHFKMRFTAEISCFESTFDTDTIEELDEDGDVGDMQVKIGS